MVTRARDGGPFAREVEHTADLGLEIEAPTLPLLFERAGLAMLRLTRVGEYVWEIPRRGGMRVPARVYASEKLIEEVRDDPALAQLANVAHLPGIVGHALAMPDIHWGYGFPIGGVAAVDAEEGVITPGGIGFDINCGVRLAVTNLQVAEIQGKLSALADALFVTIPCGVGAEGAIRG